MPRKTWIPLLGLPLLLTFSRNGCAETPAATNENAEKPVDVRPKTPVATTTNNVATTAINAFTASLYAQLRKQEGNLCLSPYSISTVLAMTSAGAQGDTKKQMVEVLKLGEKESETHKSFSELERALTAKTDFYQLAVANDLWVQKGQLLTADFTELLHSDYRATVRTANFETNLEASRQLINGYIAEQTGQKIPELLAANALNPQTRLILTNAVYFKGKWQLAFDKKDTQKLDFVKFDGSKIKVPTMYQKETFAHFEDADVQLLELPYKTADKTPGLSMVILLPKKDDGLPQIEGKLASYLNFLNDNQREEIAVFLPKFKVEAAFQLKDTLQILGMKDAFDQNKADFSAMTGKKELVISAVVHKAFIEVNEEGTEAAAATAVVTSRGRSPTFRADRPFLFWIKDNRSGTILFLGRVVEPTMAN